MELGGKNSNDDAEWSKTLVSTLKNDQDPNHAEALRLLKRAGILTENQTAADLGDVAALPAKISKETTAFYQGLSTKLGKNPDYLYDTLHDKIVTTPEAGFESNPEAWLTRLNTLVTNGSTKAANAGEIPNHTAIASTQDKLPQGLHIKSSGYDPASTADFLRHGAINNALSFAGKAIGVAGLAMTVSQLAGNLTEREAGTKLTLGTIQKNFSKNALFNIALVARTGLISASIAGISNPVTATASAITYVAMQSSTKGLELAAANLNRSEAAVQETRARRLSGGGNMLLDGALELTQGGIKNIALVNLNVSKGLNSGRTWAVESAHGTFQKVSKSCADAGKGAQEFMASML